VTRANLTVFVTAISAIGLVMLAAAGALTATLGVSAAVSSFRICWRPGSAQAIRTTKRPGVRRLALVLMLCVGVTSLAI